jgi:NTP pyrophosphatase (non-canonical NTP hydrolase)
VMLVSSEMTLSDYQAGAAKTAEYTNDDIIWAQLPEEVGEVMALKKRYLRGDLSFFQMKVALQIELGDVLWTITRLAEDNGMTLDSIAKANLNKLRDRQERGVLIGTGDKR